MHANNEIGTMHDLSKISEICYNNNAYFHCDTAQTMAKESFDLSKLRISFLSGSAHKFYGPKGVGFIYINQDNMISPLLHGGAGMAEAFRIAIEEIEQRKEHVLGIKNYCKQELLNNFRDIKFNGSTTSALYNILSVSFPESDKNEMMMMNLDIAGICASGGSACSSGVENDTHVLSHIGHDPKRKTIRFSFSHYNTREEVLYLIEKLKPLLTAK
jgi:cysteine desulfurase